MSGHSYILEVQCGGIGVEVALNGWPAVRVGDARRRITQKKLNPWLCEGDNHFDVELFPMARGAGEREDCIVTLYKPPKKTRTHEDNELFFYRWTAEDAPLAPSGHTRVMAHDWHVAQAFGRWAWQDGRPYDERDRKTIVGLLAHFHAALVARDADAVLGMMRVQMAEMARAFERDPVDMVAWQRRYLETYFGEANWAMDPFDPDTLRFEPCANRRLVRVTDSSGDSALKGRGGELTFECDFELANLTGDWEIVR